MNIKRIWLVVSLFMLPACLVYSQDAKTILEAAGAEQGNCLVIDKDEKLSLDLAETGKLRIYLVNAQQKNVDTMRLKIDKAGKYGRITCRREDLSSIFYPTYFFDLVVVNNITLNMDLFTEIYRVTKPGKTACFIGKAGNISEMLQKTDAPGVKHSQVNAEKGITVLRRGFEPSNKYIKPPLTRLWVTCDSQEKCHFLCLEKQKSPDLLTTPSGEVVKDGCMYFMPLDTYTGRIMGKVPDGGKSALEEETAPYQYVLPGHSGGEYTGHQQQIAAFDGETGKAVWVFVDAFLYRGKCPNAIFANGVVYKSEGRSLLYLNAHTGRFLGHHRNGGNMCTSVTVGRSILFHPNIASSRLQAFVSDDKRDRLPQGDILIRPKAEIRNPQSAIRNPLDWPMFHYDPCRTGHSPDTVIKPPFRLLWKFDTGGRVRSSCAVVSGTVYAGSSSHRFYALDAETGKPKWRFFTDDEIHSSPCISGDTVYFGCDDGRVYALARNTGALYWAYRTATSAPLTLLYNPWWRREKMDEWWETMKNDKGMRDRLSPDRSFRPLCFNGQPLSNPGVVRSSPLVSDGKLYVGTGLGEDGEPCFGYLYALDAGTGKLVWKKGEEDISEVGEFAFGVSGAPCMENGRIHFSYGTHTVVSSDTGRLLVKGGTFVKGRYHNSNAYYVKPDGTRARYALLNLTWSSDAGATVRGDVAVDRDTETALVATGAHVFAVDVKTGCVKWEGTYGNVDSWGIFMKSGHPTKGRSSGNLNYHSPAALSNGKAYKGGGRGIGVFNIETGGSEETRGGGAWYRSYPSPWKVFKPQQEFKGPEGFVNTAPAIANGCIFAGSDDGCVYAWDLKTGEVAWKYKTGGKVRSSPAVSGGRLYIGSDDGYVYCFSNQ